MFSLKVMFLKVDWKKIYYEIKITKISSDAHKLAKKYGYLPYMIERYLELFGYDETIELLNSFEKKVEPVIRCNDLLVDCKWLINRLEELGFELKHIPWSIHGYRIIKQPLRPSIGATHEYLKGYYYVHRDAAPLIPSLLLVKQGEIADVLDGCAAPGGKATHIAQLMLGKGLVVANDLVLYRIKALIGHVLRMGFRNIIVTWSDLRKLPRLVNKKFKKILLDVPCSAEGTIMLDPSRKKKTNQRDLARIVAREIELLKAGIELLDKDGLLVYTTCSIAPEENEYVISKITERFEDIELVKPSKKLFEWCNGITSYKNIVENRELGKCIRTYPHRHNMIGMTICLLKKK